MQCKDEMGMYSTRNVSQWLDGSALYTSCDALTPVLNVRNGRKSAMRANARVCKVCEREVEERGRV